MFVSTINISIIYVQIFRFIIHLESNVSPSAYSVHFTVLSGLHEKSGEE